MIIHGDSLEILPMLDADSFDSVVTDPPYGLSFMGKKWDHDVPGVEIWREVFRVMKPGAHLLAFFGTRTYHRGVCAIEDAGFEIRDQVQWIYGSGFPKSHDVSKAIDKMAGADRPVVTTEKVRDIRNGHGRGQGDGINASAREGGPVYMQREITAPATAAAAQWEGWGTALKPAHEPIVVARKPLAVPQEAPEGETYDADTPERPVRMRAATVAENVLVHGVGGLNIDGCRVGESGARNNGRKAGTNGIYGRIGATTPVDYGKGRWPANLIHDGSDEVLAAFPDAPGQIANVSTSSSSRKTQNVYGAMKRGNGREGEASANRRYTDEGGTNFAALPGQRRNDSGSAARYFYCAKASKSDRDDGLAEFASKPSAASEFRPNHAEKAEKGADGNPYGRWKPLKNNHPTVKPTDLMRYLCRLVTPPGGKVLDPFAGSGSTGRGAVLEGFQFTGIEMAEEYVEIARARIAAARKRYEDEVYV